MHRSRISLQEYAALCEKADVSASYQPDFVEYYFTRLGLEPHLVGVYREGALVAAFPSMFGQVFPTPLHKRILGHRLTRIGEIGQPETLFPVLAVESRISLNRLSPTTSTLLAGKVRGLKDRSLRSIGIASDRRHRKVTIRQRDFLADGGKVYFTSELPPHEFADIYVRLHSERWGIPREALCGVHGQILQLYTHVFGVVLEAKGEMVAAQLCYRAVGPTLHYVDFINSGVKLQDDNRLSYGSVMMLTCLRKAEEEARVAGKKLRFSFGYYYGDRTYKAVWTQPEPTFIAY